GRFRAIDSITLREQIVSGLKGGRKIFHSLSHYLTAVLFLRKLAVLLGRPYLNWIEHLTTYQKVSGSNPLGRASLRDLIACRLPKKTLNPCDHRLTREEIK